MGRADTGFFRPGHGMAADKMRADRGEDGVKFSDHAPFHAAHVRNDRVAFY